MQALDWASGYSSTWRVYEVNPETWVDADIVEGVSSVSIERDGTGDAPLLESGAIRLDTDVSEHFRERYMRIAMVAEQNGQAQRVDVATLLCTTTSGEVDKGFDAQEIVGRSVLYPAATTKLISGTYAPAGVDGVAWVAELLKAAIKAPIETEGSFTLNDNIVLDLGTTYLEAAWMILDAGGYCIQIQGNGVVRIVPLPSDASLLLDDAGARLLHPSIKYELDWSDVPNRFTAIDAGESVTVANNDADSPTSIASRGYIKDEVDTSPVKVNGESLTAYAERRLEELSVVPDKRTYTREYWEGIVPFSVVKGSLSSVALDGNLRVQTQSLTCDKGITVTEKAVREVYTWQR